MDSRITLGSKAKRHILESRAIPLGESPKRKFEPSPTTPMSAARRFSLSAASPKLREVVVTKKRENRKSVVNWLSKMKHDIEPEPQAESTGNSTLGASGTGKRNRTVGTRIAARFSNRDSPARKQKKRNNKLQDQPLIHDS